MSNEIKIPQILLEQRNYCLRINESNTKLFAYVDYLKKLITSTHAIYLKLCKRMIQVTESTQRQLINTKYTTSHGLVILNFIKNIGYLHLTLNNQLNTNNIALGTKSHKIFKNRLEILGEKLNKCNEINRSYLEMVEVYNKKQKSLKEKCEYFNDYEKDVLKYFSLKANIDQYEKIYQKELKIKGRLEQLIRFKDQYKINISEIRTSVKEYYQMELNIISEYKKLLLNIRKQKVNNKKIYEPIFQQPSEDAASTIQQAPLSKRSQRSRQKSIVLMRKQIIKQYERCSEIQQLFQDLMKVYTEQIQFAGKRVDQVRGEDEYQTFISERLIMSEILPPESLKDVDIIINQITLFRSIILKLLNIFGKRTVLGELKKYRGFNFDKFVEDSNQFAEAQRKNGFSINLSLDYKIVEQKFYSSHNQYNGRYGQRINELLKAIISTVYSQDNGVQQIKNKKNIRSNLFQKKYYQILAHPFFLNRMQSVKYVENVHLKKFNDHINANKIQKIMTLTGFHKKKSVNRARTTCCGLFRAEDKQNEQVEGPKLIDDYHCALKDGLILIQGKLNLYENYLNFTSFFNPKKIFGYSDIRIPKWDINNFSTTQHIFSIVIVVETTHGNLQFTSFMNSPLEKLQNLYNNRKSGVSRIQFRASRQSQLQVLQQRFQRQLRHQLRSKDIITDKLSTYLTQDFQNLSICIEYHINGTGLNHLFQIKINFSEMTIDFTFIHDEENDNKEVKNILENISKEIIERQSGFLETEQAQNKQNNNFSIDFDYSVIEQNEKNKISFLRQPSFMNRLSQTNKFNQQQTIRSNIQIGPLLNSKQLIYNQQTSRNIQLLEQRILQSQANEQKSLGSNDHSANIVSQFTEQQTIQKRYTPLPLTLERPSSKITVKSHSRCKTKTARSKSISSSTSSSSNKISPTTILIFLGIVLGINMMLNFFNH